jgi:hypothetical protein
MSEKKMVVIDQELIKKIDRNRGILGRVEFVTRCVQATMAEMEPEMLIAEAGAEAPEEAAAEEGYVTKEEFADFRKNMEAIQREFLNFFTTYGRHLLGEPLSDEEKERFSTEFRRLLDL